MRPLGAGVPFALVLFVSVTLSALILLTPRAARAEAPGARALPVHVLGLDSDDAEDNADSLTGALRSRVRVAPGWSLQETQHSLGMLTAALRCPPLPQRPDAACTQRIGDQLHTDRFIWGVVSKAGPGQVSAEIHLWSRGKPDVSAKETYSDNLKDANDEVLRKIASRILDRLSGAGTPGTLVVHATEVESGGVWINGQRKQALDHGAATLELPAGTYQVEVRAPGFAPAQQANVAVVGGQETPVTLKLVAEAAAPPAERSTPTNTRRIIAWTAIGVGGVAIVGASVEGLRFLSLKSDLDADRAKIDRGITDVCAVPGNPDAADACSKFNDAKSARTVGLVLGSAGIVAAVVGVVLLATDHGSEPASDQPRAAWTVMPIVSPRGPSGASFSVTF